MKGTWIEKEEGEKRGITKGPEVNKDRITIRIIKLETSKGNKIHKGSGEIAMIEAMQETQQ